MSDQISLTIDGKVVTVPKGTTVYTAAKSLGSEIPIFCYHDKMPPFGACRVCLVEVEKMPKLQTSCTLQAQEGMVVKTTSGKAEQGRKEILEFLLINHPLDCPVCDRGGECPLQEHVLNHGPAESRFFEEKRKFKKPLPLGPVLQLDRERCIVCARCTRFCDTVSGDHALEMVERGFKSEVGTPGNAPADSKFIGNTIMICPVGALTSQVYRFRARPWDNEPAETTCTLCPVGCSMILDSRDGQVMRTRSKENSKVNDIWLCDKGWFGYEFSAHPDRLKEPLIRRGEKLVPASWEEAFSLIAEKLKGSQKIAAFGGNPLTVEENLLFRKLYRDGLQVNNLDHRIGVPECALTEEGLPPGMASSIEEIDRASCIVLLGLDITEEFPVLWLRMKKAIDKGASVIFLGHKAPEITSYLKKTVVHMPGREIEVLREHFPKNVEHVLLFVGRQYLYSQGRAAFLAELAKVAGSSPINVMEGSGGSIGARFAGVHPELGSKKGLSALQVLKEAALKEWDFLHVAGANPKQKYPSSLFAAARRNLKFLVVQDLFLTETAAESDVVLPALAFTEKGGSFLNIEGREQFLRPGKETLPGALSDGEIFIEIAKRLGIKLSWDEPKPYIRSASFSGSRGGEVPNIDASKLYASFTRELFDHGVRMKHNPHAVWLAKEPFVRLHPQEGKKRKLAEGAKVQIRSKEGTCEAKVVFDLKVALSTVVVPTGFSKVAAHELGENLWNGMEIEIHAI